MRPTFLDVETRAAAVWRFRNLRGGGGVHIGFHSFGPPVSARTPDELAYNAEDILVGLALGQPLT